MTRVRVVCHQCDTSLSTCDVNLMVEFIVRHPVTSIVEEEVYSQGLSRLFAEAEKIVGGGQ